ncbi:MAG: glycosyltransferase family 1 protein [Bdellovibrionota bacterium]
MEEVKADLFHAPSFVAPLICPCKLVMTIHDLNHMVLPQFYTPLHQFYYQIFVRSCAIRSEYILTVSDFSKKELVRNFTLDPGKIFVTYNGVSENYVRVEDKKYLAYVRELYELPENYIFCISNDKPHKNIKQLVRAYCFSDLQIPLVLASPVDRELIRMAELYGKKHLVFFSKYIRERHLPAVYSMARLFVYPSTYEGFGLPPLEALACGIPAVVARSSSLPEVVGSNAIFADPYDFQDIAKALKMGIEDDNIREELCSRGVQHAKKYSWLAMAKKTLDVYEQCLSASKSLTVGEVL